MIYRLPSVVFRLLLGVVLLASLGSCGLSRKVFHPYRLPTPKPSPEFIAQQKEAAARKKANASLASSLSKKKSSEAGAEAATDVSGPSGDPTASAATASERKLPERSTVRYDKQELMKKPKLKRRRVHEYHKPFYHKLLRPLESIRDFFKYRLHAKPNYDIDHRPAPRAPKDDTTPDATPDAKP